MGETQFKASPSKGLARYYLKKKLGVVAYTCGPSYLGGEGRRIAV
jgi:hypothetical protein